jgi:transportin-1
LPLLRDQLARTDGWRVREGGILALGAVAGGCIKGLSEHLPKLIDYLLVLLRDPVPLVRSISSWCLSRYAAWVMLEPDDEVRNSANESKAHVTPSVRAARGRAHIQYSLLVVQPSLYSPQRYFRPLLVDLLKRVLDKSKRVQENACSAFSTVLEAAGMRVVPYLVPILQNLMFAFQHYQVSAFIRPFVVFAFPLSAYSPNRCHCVNDDFLLPPFD